MTSALPAGQGDRAFPQSRRDRGLRRARRAAVLALAFAIPLRLGAQLDLGGAVIAGGDEHWHRRNIALLDSAADDPWRAHLTPSLAGPGLQLRLLRTELRLVLNEARPSPDDQDGVIWAGRGATGSVQAGFEARWRLIHLQLAPIAFSTENRAFPLVPNGQPPTSPLVFGDPRFPGNIDAPQRFGDRPYGRIDTGDSFLAVEWRGLTTGLSSARLLWGPARDYPLVLGTAAGGFPHLFVGTVVPMTIPLVGQISGRLIGGRLEQSSWSPIQSGESRRLHVGLTVSLRPALTPWWELGASRTDTGPWPAGGPTVRDLLGPFSSVFSPGSTGAANRTGTNGFASVFTRIAVPGSGMEAYAEYSFEDFSNDFRRFVQKIDDLSTYTVGIARAWITDGAVHRIGLETTNGELSHQERVMRGLERPIPPYTHSATVQGLTSRGQILGSGATYRGAGSSIRYGRQRRHSDLQVRALRERLLDWLPSDGSAAVVTSVLGATAQWTHLSATLERSLWLGYSGRFRPSAVRQAQGTGWQLGVRLRAGFGR